MFVVGAIVVSIYIPDLEVEVYVFSAFLFMEIFDQGQVFFTSSFSVCQDLVCFPRVFFLKLCERRQNESRRILPVWRLFCSTSISAQSASIFLFQELVSLFEIEVSS